MNIIRFLSEFSISNQFLIHNKKLFPASRNCDRNTPVILMEFNGMRSAHIAYSYLANTLALKHNAQIKSYFGAKLTSPLQRCKWFLANLLNIGHFATYRSFGVNEFISITLSSFQRKKALQLYSMVSSSINSKVDVESLHLDGVWVGDLLYDSYLKKFKVPTIDTSSKTFLTFFLEFVETFIFWSDYFDDHDVRAINVSHCVYVLALPLRIAIQRGIDGFQANATHVYRLSMSNLFAYNDFKSFPERFDELPDDVRNAGLSLAKDRIQRRFRGEVGVDMSYSKKSAYGDSRPENLLVKSNKKKILIATHCFFDSPHSYGKNLFPDFYEWLHFLGMLSDKTDYDWYIKTHPDFLPRTKEVVMEFVQMFPKFHLLPSSASHLQIVDEGIDVALTCYGTIGFEYAALGVPVINASINNPHIAYDFNIHPRSIDEYSSILYNIQQLELNIDSRQIYQYYFMKFIFNTQNLFFSNYQHFLDRIGGYRYQFSPAAYRHWLCEFSNDKHHSIKNDLSKFVDSGDFRMDHRHSPGSIDFDLIRLSS